MSSGDTWVQSIFARK